MFIECIGDKNETRDMYFYLLAIKTIIVIIIITIISNGNRIEWSTIQGVIGRVI